MTRALASLSMFAAFAMPALADPKPGEALYRAQCAKCHGAIGEGVKKKYDKPLTGDLSVVQLAEVIRKTMPSDAPESLSKEDAASIAGYVHAAFYSPAARERLAPARIDLARLTVNQYRQSVADLIGGFRGGTNNWSSLGGTGLKGEYFANRGYGSRQLERTDPMVKFDFGTNTPPEGKYPEPEFSIRWSGSLLAPDTGEYTFTVKCDQSVRLWVNGPEPVVNALVRSGNQTEYTASVLLTGGRVYPVRLEFSKALQGVKDKKPKPTPASVSLEWKPPHGTAEPIPTRYLSPAGVPEQYAVAVSFPPDDKSMGWERGTAVSKEWDAATTEGALDAAAYVMKNLNDLAGIDRKAPQDKKLERAKKFAGQFVERAFRRPLSAEQAALYVDKQFAAANNDLDSAVQRVVLLALKSPRFLFREPADATDDYAVAARLSYSLWDSLPDEPLRTAAAQGKLKSKDEVAKQAERMLTDPRAKAKVHGFLLHWLRLDNDRDLGKSAKLFPEFDAATISDLRTSLDLFLNAVVWAPESDFRKLLKADEVYLNGRLAKLYGADLPPDAPFQPVKLDAGKRAGVLTHPYLMTAFAYAEHSSPIHRGVFLAKGILGTALKPPQEAFTPLPASAHPMLSTRERVELQTKGANCMTCHSVINPLGFTLESFDAVGKWRDTDNGKPIDVTGGYLTRSGEAKKFTGAVELAAFLADSPDVHSAFAEQLFHHLVQQPVQAYGPNRAKELRDSFAAGGYNMRKLIVEMVASAAVTGRSK